MSSGNRDYIKELAEWDKVHGVTKRHATWGPLGQKMTEQEKAKVFLSVIWEMERGHTTSVPHMCKPWWYKGNLRPSVTSWLRRAGDKILGVKNPYK